ncbi:hypothetical protein LTR62_004068 [Meristemomyces frigidus]|uniref:Uncharacterized protein n=1 Tax=Meristemomyces frigidus TaxID=1508187 RepID=A0AAN7THZ1_9PEZI|nr:hypothetical protein LTR62_004068 [Meristemomyces frigidus]
MTFTPVGGTQHATPDPIRGPHGLQSLAALLTTTVTGPVTIMATETVMSTMTATTVETLVATTIDLTLPTASSAALRISPRKTSTWTTLWWSTIIPATMLSTINSRSSSPLRILLILLTSANGVHAADLLPTPSAPASTRNLLTTITATSFLAGYSLPTTTAPTAKKYFPDKKGICYETVSGLAFPSPCPTYYVWTRVQGPSSPTDAPGSVCVANGIELPFVDVHSGGLGRVFISHLLALLTILGTLGFILHPRGVLERVAVGAMLLVGYAGAAGPVQGLGVGGEVGLYKGVSAGVIPSLLDLRCLDGKGMTWYMTDKGPMLPGSCIAGTPVEWPTSALEPSQCVKEFAVYDRAEPTKNSSVSVKHVAEKHATLALIGLPLLFAEGGMHTEAVAALWLVLVVNVGGAQAADVVLVSDSPETTSGDTRILQANACPLIDGLQACPLPGPTYVPASSAATAYSSRAYLTTPWVISQLVSQTIPIPI